MTITKLILIGGVVISIAVVGYLFIAGGQKKSENGAMTNIDQIGDQESEEKMDENPQSENSNATMIGSYSPYSKEALEASSNKRRVLFFYASWCPTCRPTDQSFSQNIDKIPSDVTIIRVNYNDPETDKEEEELAKKYGITYQHTFVQIDGQGNQITKWNGGAIDELISNIK